MSKELEIRGNNPIAVLRSYFSNESVKKRFEEMLGKRAGAFLNSIINVYSNDAKLQNCTPQSVGSAALRAATFDMPVDPALGQAAIIPYGNTANFQLMYKGITQLCIRSGKYATIHCSEVYEDEIKYHNPITGEVIFNDPATYKMRYLTGKGKKYVGHYAYFKLLSGFEKSDYMPTEEAMAHGAKYSAAYKYDLAKKKKSSVWSTDPVVMCNKTVLLRLLTKYGVMSIEMQDAIIGERESFEDAQERADKTIKNEAGSEPIDTTFESDERETKKKVKKQKDKLSKAEIAAAANQQPVFMDESKD